MRRMDDVEVTQADVAAAVDPEATVYVMCHAGGRSQ